MIGIIVAMNTELEAIRAKQRAAAERSRKKKLIRIKADAI